MKTPALKQLLSRATLEQTLLIEEVLRLLADECAAVKEMQVKVERDTRWLEHFTQGMYKFFEPELRGDARTRNALKSEIDWLRKTFEEKEGTPQ